MLRVGVVGATSRVGRFVVAALRDRSANPVALVRREVSGVETRRCDLLDPDSFPEAVKGLDVVVSVAGAPVSPYPMRPRTTFEAVDRDGHVALGQAAAEAGVRRFVYVSVHGDGMEDLPYVRTHYDAEAAIASTGMEFSAVRPVGLFGAFEQMLPVARWRMGFDIAGGRSKTNPLSEEDLADQLVEQVFADTPDRVKAVGGPEFFERREVWDLAFDALGVRGVHLPSFQIGLIGAAVPLRLLDKRAGDTLRFLAHVLCHESTAPPCGTRRLGRHLAEVVRRAR